MMKIKVLIDNGHGENTLVNVAPMGDYANLPTAVR